MDKNGNLFEKVVKTTRDESEECRALVSICCEMYLILKIKG